MKLKVWNSLSEIVLSFLFALMVSILLNPWLNLLDKVFNTNFNIQYKLFWIISIIIIVIFASHYFEKIRKDIVRNILILTFVVLNILAIKFMGWKLILFGPLFLLLILAGLRYRLYGQRVGFKTDFSLGILLLLFNLMLRAKLNFSIDYLNIIIFFGTMISFTILFNYRYMKRTGYSSESKTIIIVISIVFFTVICFSFLAGIPLDNSFFKGIVSIIGWIYHLIGQLLLIIIYPIVWLLGPLMESLTNLKRKPRPEQPKNVERKNIQDQLNKYVKHKEPTNNSHIAHYIYWTLFILGVTLIIIYFVKKYSQKKQLDKKQGYLEEKESVFSLDELKKDFSRLFSGFKKIFSRQEGKGRHYGDSPVMAIREIYYHFLIRYNDIVSIYYFDTPLEYLQRLVNRSELRNRSIELQELTKLYNQARFKEEVDLEDVEKARELWGKLKDKSDFEE